MGFNKKTLISISVQLGVAIALALFIAVSGGLMQSVNASQVFHHLCDGLFVSSILFVGIGGLLWISATGFFDIFGYAFKSIVHLLTPSKYDEQFPRYYDYKCEQNEKREGKPLTHTVIVVGLIVLALSFLCLALYNHFLPAAV
ncbi:MAG: DUF3899 domain-containing protein [Clostridia bacterium]|nr:DUF3899 domain-containing protein [Clostridia bacterium]